MDTKQLRVNYQNKWPNIFSFPAENLFIERIQSAGITKVFEPAQLEYCDTYQFQFYLGYLLDALDMLPMRPDLAFENIWKALDAEFFIVQAEIGIQNASRFDGFIDRVTTDSNTAGAFKEYLKIIPYQTCEYAAKRIIQASTDENLKALYTRARNSLGEQFINALIAKYPATSNGKPSPPDQRKAGRLFKKIFAGEEIELEGQTYIYCPEDLIRFLIKVVLANYRNERFHGGVFPPFRSSHAKLATYSHAYFLFHISYSLLLEVFLYREYGVITASNVKKGIELNTNIFSALFKDVE